MNYKIIMGMSAVLLSSGCFSDLEANKNDGSSNEVVNTQTNIQSETSENNELSTSTESQNQTDTLTQSITQTQSDVMTHSDVETKTLTQTKTETQTQSDVETLTVTQTQSATQGQTEVGQTGELSITHTHQDDTYVFRANAFEFPDDANLEYVWSIVGSNITDEGRVFTHTFDFTLQDEFELLVSSMYEGVQYTAKVTVYASVCEQEYSAQIVINSMIDQQVVLEGKGLNCSDAVEISQYQWDFGDGNVLTTAESLVSHEYAQGGEYTVQFTYEFASTTKIIEIADQPLNVSCEQSHNYGQKQSTLLSSDEYNNAVLDLTGIDSKLAYDVNNVSFSLFTEQAKLIASLSETQNFENIVNCEFITQSACSQKYLNNVLPLIHRQSKPLTHTYDRLYDHDFHADFFEQYDFNMAMKYSLVSALSSPQFLFHSLLGETKQSIIEGIEVLQRVDFAQVLEVGSPIIQLDLDEQGIPLYQSYSNSSIDVEQSGEYALSVYLKGMPYGGLNPYLELNVNHQSVETIEVDWQTIVRLDLNVNLTAGSNVISIGNVTGQEGYNSSSLILDRMDISPWVSIPFNVRSNTAYFDLYDNNDFVLSNWEIATLLSFNYLGTVPDTELTELAITKALDDTAIVQQQIERLSQSDQSMTWEQMHNVEQIEIPLQNCMDQQSQGEMK
ncbi:PKD domain-containing protein [Marinicellulosiphila megalodicopiae]|uniref:PKD domain-containing protein n=1 Tax=Marinicellulosiphila megalodicopiae TaxID=2724896 RepID=UPI003BB1C5E4